MKLFWRLLADRRRGGGWWALGMAVGVASIVGLWPTVEGNTEIQQLVDDLPASVKALIGSQAAVPLSSAPGYLQARLFSSILPILLLVYAIGLGARVVGGAEEDGTLQLVVTSPVSRRRVALERLGASLVLVLGLGLVGLATTLVLGAVVGLTDDVGSGRMVLAFSAVVALAVLHLALAFAAGAFTGRRGPGIALASAVAVGTYLLHGIAASAPSIQAVRVVSPWWWLLDRNLLVQRTTWFALALPIAVAVVAVIAGLIRYEHRDLRFP